MSYISDRQVTPPLPQTPVGKPPEVQGPPAPAAATPTETPSAPATELAPQDSATLQTAADTPIEPVVDERVQFPPVSSAPKTAGDPTAATIETVAPSTLPAPLQESYADLSKRLNSNPQVNYIELDKPELNKGLSQFLNQFKAQLDNTPGLREKLAQTQAGKALLEVLENASKGALSSQDILKLQTFIVSAGEDISHPNSPSGIDGAFGPRTHQGLQNAFDKLLNKTDETIQNFDARYAEASQRAEAQQSDYENMGGDIPAGGYSTEPTASGTATPTGAGAPAPGPAGTSPSNRTGEQTLPTAGADTRGITGPPPPAGSATGLGREILSAVNQTRGPMAARLAQLRRQRGMSPNAAGPFRCYEGVKQVLNRLNPPVSLTGGSAYMAADQLRRHSDRFQEVQLRYPPDQATRDYLKSLPAGAVVVWGPSNNPAKRAAGERAGNGYGHGHISVALGNGYEFSDRDRAQIVGSGRDPERYGSVTVFLPRDAGTQPTQ